LSENIDVLVSEGAEHIRLCSWFWIYEKSIEGRGRLINAFAIK
jgi:hypothetical protein